MGNIIFDMFFPFIFWRIIWISIQ